LGKGREEQLELLQYYSTENMANHNISDNTIFWSIALIAHIIIVENEIIALGCCLLRINTHAYKHAIMQSLVQNN
jgi:hypothetical protein